MTPAMRETLSSWAVFLAKRFAYLLVVLLGISLVPFAEDPDEVLREMRNSVLRYENPTEPVASEDWESLK